MHSRWLDSTPTGRIIARCTQDITAGNVLLVLLKLACSWWPSCEVDGAIPGNLNTVLEITITLIQRIIAIIFVTPLFTIPSLIVGAIGAWCGQLYMKAQLSVKRESSNAKSPVLNHFGAAMTGLGRWMQYHRLVWYTQVFYKYQSGRTVRKRHLRQNRYRGLIAMWGLQGHSITWTGTYDSSLEREARRV